MNYGRHLISYGGVEGRHVLLRATGEYLSMGNFAVKYRMVYRRIPPPISAELDEP
jgi:hypothetical protein